MSAAHMGRELTGTSFYSRVSQVSLCRWVDEFRERRARSEGHVQWLSVMWAAHHGKMDGDSNQVNSEDHG